MEEERQKEYVTYDVAELIKEKKLYNFSYPHYFCYCKGKFVRTIEVETLDLMSIAYLAPHLYDMQRWLREVPNLSVEVYTNASGWCWQVCKAFKHYSVTCGTWLDDFTNHFDEGLMNDGGSYDTYEAALNAGIKRALEIGFDRK